MKNAVRATQEADSFKLTDVKLGDTLTTVEVLNPGTYISILLSNTILLIVNAEGIVTVERHASKGREYLTEKDGVLEYRTEYPYAGTGRSLVRLVTGLGQVLGQ